MNKYRLSFIFLLSFLALCLVASQSNTFLVPTDRIFVPVSQVQFTIDLPDGNTTDAQLLEFECTERLYNGYITVNGTTYYIECVKPVMRVPLVELGRIPAKVNLHANVATLAPDAVQYRTAQEYARSQAKAKPDNQISTSPAGRSLLGIEGLLGGSVGLYFEVQSLKKDVEYAKQTAEKALSLGEANSDRLNVHDQDIAMLSTILTGSTCTKPSCIGTGGVIGQLARSNLTETFLLNRTDILLAQADRLQAQLTLQMNATETVNQRVQQLAAKTQNATNELSRQINSNLALLRDDTNMQIQAIYTALNSTQQLIDSIRQSGDGDFEYIYTQITQLQDSAINSYATINSLSTHKTLRNIITRVFFDDLQNLDPELVPLLKDSGINPNPVFSGPDSRIVMESIDMCFLIPSVSVQGGNRIVCQTYNIYSNVYYAIESTKYSVNYKHLLNSMGPIGCIRPYVDETSPLDYDNNIDPSLNTSTPCQFYAEVVEKSCELSPTVTNFDFRYQNLSLGVQEQDINIAKMCGRYNSPVITTGSTQGVVLRTSPDLSDFIKTKACQVNLTLPYYYTRFYQTGTTIIIPQDQTSCDLSLSQMERLASKRKSIPLFVAFGTGWKLGWIQAQKLVSTLSLKMRGRMPGGVSNTDINYMPWTPTRVDAVGNPILDGGADAMEQWTIYWLAVSPDTIPVYAAQSVGKDSVSASARIAITVNDTCNPSDPTCYNKELKLGVKDIVLDAATYDQFPDLPYVYLGDIENAAFTGMYDAPSNLISAGFDPSIQVNKITCLLMPPGTNRTLDIQYFWDVKGTLYDPKTCGIDPSQFRYDAFVTADGYPYCNINGGSPVDYEGRQYPNACSVGFNYNSSTVIDMYKQNQCSSASLCDGLDGCLSIRELVPFQMVTNSSAAFISLPTSPEIQSMRVNSFVAEFWISNTNNSAPNSRYSILFVNGASGNLLYIENFYGALNMYITGISTVFTFGSVSGFFPPTILDVPVHFVIQVHGTTVQLFVNGALRFRDDYPALSTMTAQWTLVRVASGTQILTDTFVYGVRLLRYNQLLNSAWKFYQCGPYSSKGSGCTYDPSTVGASSFVAEHDLRTNCPLTSPFREVKLLTYEGSTFLGNSASLPLVNWTALKQSSSTILPMVISFIDMRPLNMYPSTSTLVASFMIPLDTGFYAILNITSVGSNQITISCYHNNGVRTATYTIPAATLLPRYSSTFYSIKFDLRATGIGPLLLVLNGYVLNTSSSLTTLFMNPLSSNYLPSYITKLSFFYNPVANSAFPSDLFFSYFKCQILSFTHLPSAYSTSIASIYANDLIWQPPYGQCIMSTTLPGFGYCRTPSMCGGRCQAWSMVNTTSRTFIPLSHVCDAGYAPPDCVRPCSRKDSFDGYCIDQYFKATSKNGFAPTSSHCATARTAGMTTVTTNKGKFLVATPYEWRQTFKVIIPSGKINIKAANSVCPTISNAFQRADGKVTVALTNNDNKESRVVVSWFPSNPADAIDAAPECINVDGNAITLKANTVGYFFLPGNGCGNLTISISTLNGITTGSECSRLTTNDVALIVNQQDVTANLSPVVTRIETAQVNIVEGLQTAIEDVTKSLINAFTNMLSLVDNSRSTKNYSDVLINLINNAPKTNYNPNVTVTTNFSDPDADARFREIMEAADRERTEFERLKNKSVEETARYITELNNVNVTTFLLGLVGDSILKGFNVTSRRDGTFDPRNPYPEQCGSTSSGGSSGTFLQTLAYKNIQKQPALARRLLGLGLPDLDLPGGVDVPIVGQAFDQFSKLMCGVTVAASQAVTLAKDGAEVAINKAEDAADKGLDIVSSGLGSPLDFLSKALGAFVYIIPAAILLVGGYYSFKLFQGNECCRRADRNKDRYGKRSNKVAQLPSSDVVKEKSSAANSSETKRLVRQNAASSSTSIPNTKFTPDMN